MDRETCSASTSTDKTTCEPGFFSVSTLTAATGFTLPVPRKFANVRLASLDPLWLSYGSPNNFPSPAGGGRVRVGGAVDMSEGVGLGRLPRMTNFQTSRVARV